MKQRILLYDQDARQRLKAGIDALANMVKVTLGPKGNNVIIERTAGAPLITKDGVTVAKEIFLEDSVENMGAQLIKEVASKTNETAGDGTTTATVLAQALISEGLKNVTAGANPMDLKRGMDIAVKEISKELKSISRSISSKEDVTHVASISANNDLDIGLIVVDAVEAAGKEGTVIVEDAKGVDTFIEVVEGVQFDRGYTYTAFVNKKQTMEVELNNVFIFLYNGTLNQSKSIIRLLEQVTNEDQVSLLIIADEFSEELSKLLTVNTVKGNIRCCAVISPGFGDRRYDLLNDIAVATGGNVFGGLSPYNLTQVSLSLLGKADKVVIDKNKTVIVGGKGDPTKIKETVDQIKYLLSNTSVDFDIQKLQERLGKLTGGIVVLRVGAVMEMELKEKKMRIEDALHATRAALEEGIVPGGGVSLIRVRKCLKSQDLQLVNGDVEDQKVGINIVYKALEIPFLSICENAGVAGIVLLNDVEKSEILDYGYDALNNVTGNLFELGVIDPTKVVRLALENAVSAAGLFLTTKGVVAQSEDEKQYLDKLMLSNI